MYKNGFIFSKYKIQNTREKRRKMLQIGSDIRRFFFHIVGKGDRTSAWFDTWHVEGSPDTIISRRDIYRGGFHPKSVVKDLLHNNT